MMSAPTDFGAGAGDARGAAPPLTHAAAAAAAAAADDEDHYEDVVQPAWDLAQERRYEDALDAVRRAGARFGRGDGGAFLGWLVAAHDPPEGVVRALCELGFATADAAQMALAAPRFTPQCALVAEACAASGAAPAQPEARLRMPHPDLLDSGTGALERVACAVRLGADPNTSWADQPYVLFLEMMVGTKVAMGLDADAAVRDALRFLVPLVVNESCASRLELPSSYSAADRGPVPNESPVEAARREFRYRAWRLVASGPLIALLSPVAVPRLAGPGWPARALEKDGDHALKSLVVEFLV